MRLIVSLLIIYLFIIIFFCGNLETIFLSRYFSLIIQREFSFPLFLFYFFIFFDRFFLFR